MLRRTAFNRNTVKQGDLLALRRDERQQLRFKFMGHGGDIVATWVEPPPGRPQDAILRQRDVWVVTC